MEAPPTRASPADSIKIVLYMDQETDPIIRYITDAVASDDTNTQRVESDGEHRPVLRGVTTRCTDATSR